MISLKDIESILKKNKKKLEEEYNVDIIGIFGSFARGEQKTDSDIDILVEFREHATLFDIAGLADALESEFNIKVDIVPRRALKSRFKKSILDEVIAI